METIREIFADQRALEGARAEERHFTRNRKTPFAQLLEYLPHGSKGATRSALNEFFPASGRGGFIRRGRLCPKRGAIFDRSPFLKAFYEAANAEYNLSNDANPPRRYGYKFPAVDGSVILPDWSIKNALYVSADATLKQI